MNSFLFIFCPLAGQALTFFFDKKVTKKSRQNNASPLKPNAWPAILPTHPLG